LSTIFELLGDEPAADAAPVETPGQFQRGLRAGFLGAGSQLQSVAGGAAEAAGYDEFAAARHAAARGLQSEAQAAGPRINQFQDVTNLRDAYDYVTGVAGGVVPSAVTGIGGALAGLAVGGPVGAVAGGALAALPFEAGEIVQRQQNDPVSLRTAADDRFGQALGGGALSAGLQGLVPGGVAGKLAGKVAAPTVREALGDVGKAVLVEGGAEAGGEVVKQGATMLSSPDRPFDPMAVAEAGVAGAIGGGAMAGPGLAADLGRAALQSPGNTLAGVKERGLALLAPDGAPEAEKTASGAVPAADPVDFIKGLYDQGTQKARQFVQTVADGKEGWAEDIRDKTPEWIKENMPRMDGERMETVKGWADDMLAKGGLDEARRAQLAEAMGDLSDRGNQAIVAGLKKGRDATQAFGEKAKGLYEAFKKRDVDVEAREVPDRPGLPAPKLSEDYEGVRQAIARELVPALKRVNPDLFDDPTALKSAAEGVRLAIDAYSKGGKDALTSTQAARLRDTFGDEAVNVLDSAFRAMGSTKAAERENFYGALNELSAQKKDEDKTLGFMMRSLTPELQEGTKTTDVREELKALREWARGVDKKSEAGKFDTERMRFTLESRYGKNADKVLEMVEKDTKAKDSILADEAAFDQNNVMDEKEFIAANQGRTTYYGREDERGGRTGMSLRPDVDPAGDKGQAAQALARAEKSNPDKTVRFLSSEELGMDHPIVQQKLKQLVNDFTTAGKDASEAQVLAEQAVKQYGIVVAEGSRDQPGRIDDTNVKRIQVGEKTSHRQQPSVFKVDNLNFDAIALTKLMKEQFKDDWVAEDDKGAQHRTGRLFMAGVAGLMDMKGKAPVLPDSLVIDHDGTTYGDVKKLGYAPPNAMADRLEAKLGELRKEFAAETDLQRRAEIRERAFALVEHAKSFDPRMDHSNVTGRAKTDRNKLDPFEQVEAIVKEFRTTIPDMTQDVEVAGADPDPRGNVHARQGQQARPRAPEARRGEDAEGEVRGAAGESTERCRTRDRPARR
jgi:hypothetical protein